jgi:hypothetical protein
VTILVLGLLSPFFYAATSAAVMLMAAYLTALVAGSVLLCAARGKRRLIPVIPLIIGIYHFSFGYGFLRGVFDFVVRQKVGSKRLSDLTRASRTQTR